MSRGVYCQTRALTLASVSVNVLLFLYLMNAWRKPCDDLFAQQLTIQPLSATGHSASPPTLDSFAPLTVSPTTRRLLSTESPSTTPLSAQLAAVTNPELGRVYTPPAPSASLNIKKDISKNNSWSIKEHEHTWNYCDLGPDQFRTESIPFCSTHPTHEQKYQMAWYGDHVVPWKNKHSLPSMVKCVQIPPEGYQWPNKYQELPASKDAVHWPNLRVQSREDLVVFNEAHPKNLYHFDAAKYDADALEELTMASKYIPFANKVRLVLDVGAGGGSLGLLLKRKYDTQTLSTIFADWPYCEYITLRGGNCMLVDTMEPMPFAKFSFDVLHASWVYHGQQPEELAVQFTELNRVLRPGGYFWMRGGWNQRQVDAIKTLFNQLGYVPLLDEIKEKPADIQKKVSFGPNLPYQVDWNCIYVKPIKAVRRSDCPADKK